MGRPIWLDEANSALIAGREIGGIAEALSRDNNLPLYYFVLHAWMRVFGNSEIALRSLSAVFYLGGCLAVFAMARRFTGQRRAGWYAALFYESSALAVRQAQNVRMYSLLGLLSALSTWCWLRVFRDRERSGRAWMWFFVVNALGLLTHVWFVFVLIGQAAATVLFERRQIWRFLLSAAGSTLPFVVLWGRVFWEQLHNGATGWMPRLQPTLLVLAVFEFYGPVASVLLFALATYFALRSSSKVAPLFVMFVVSAAVPLAVSFVKPIYWPGRYLIIALPPLAAILGSVLAAAPRALAAAAGLLVLSLQVPAHIAARELVPEAPLPPGQSDRTTARFLLDRAAAGDAIVLTSLTRAPADHYFNRAGAASRFEEFSFPADTATHLGWMDPGVSPERRTVLEAEANALAAHLRSLASDGRTVWVYDGGAPNVTSILVRELDGKLRLRAAHALQGPYHKRILEYGM